jgi:hypothetical protein
MFRAGPNASREARQPITRAHAPSKGLPHKPQANQKTFLLNAHVLTAPLH